MIRHEDTRQLRHLRDSFHVEKFTVDRVWLNYSKGGFCAGLTAEKRLD